ncbi:hypothetical protein [Mariniluteicoccus endophyticus]
MPAATGRPAPGRPTASPTRRRTLQVLLGVVSLVVLTVVGTRALAPVVTAHQNSMAELAVGECVQIVPRPDKGRGATGGMNITHQKVGCNTAGVVTYAVGAVGEGKLECPNGNYMEYFEVDEAHKERPRLWTACLMPNLMQGACYQPDNLTKAFTVAQCGASALFRVESMADVDDVRRCSATSEPFTFPVPARTYCVSSLT